MLLSDSTLFASNLNPHPGAQIATCFTLLSAIYATLTLRFFSFLVLVSMRRNLSGSFLQTNAPSDRLGRRQGGGGGTSTFTQTDKYSLPHLQNRHTDLSHAHISYLRIPVPLSSHKRTRQSDRVSGRSSIRSGNNGNIMNCR